MRQAIASVDVLDKVETDHSYMVLITCKKCGDINYLTSKALGNLTDFGYKCRNCNTINRITLEDGELKKQLSGFRWWSL
jgi:RNase P subunit RPR2